MDILTTLKPHCVWVLLYIEVTYDGHVRRGPTDYQRVVITGGTYGV